jgi:hypothetical protein
LENGAFLEGVADDLHTDGNPEEEKPQQRLRLEDRFGWMGWCIA